MCQTLCDVLHMFIHVCLILSQLYYIHFAEKKDEGQKLQAVYPSPPGKKLGFMTPKPVIHTMLCYLPKTGGKRNEHLMDTRFDQDCS